MNIFEKGAKEKVRFYHHGSLMIEDLWDLPIDSLNLLYRQINNDLKTLNDEGLIKNNSINNETLILQLQLDLIKHIFTDKQEKIKIAKIEKIHRERKNRIMEIITNKQDQSLEEKSVDELMNMLEKL